VTIQIGTVTLTLLPAQFTTAAQKLQCQVGRLLGAKMTTWALRVVIYVIR